MPETDYQKLADKTWDSEIVRMTGLIHEQKGKLSMMTEARQAPFERLENYARTESITASNRIDDITTSGPRLRRVIEDHARPKTEAEREIAGTRDVYDRIEESFDDMPLDADLIGELYKNMYRLTEHKSDAKYLSQTKKQAVEAICEAYDKALRKGKVDPLLLIPAFLADFVAIHPFPQGNERFSRLLSLLLLEQSGYTIPRLVSMDRYIESTQKEYEKALRAATKGFQEGESDPTPFVRYFLQILNTCCDELEDRWDTQAVTGKASAMDIVRDYVRNHHGQIKRSEVMNACPRIGRSSVAAALKMLVEEGVLVRVGKGRAVVYRRSDEDALPEEKAGSEE